MSGTAFNPPADWRGLGIVTDYESLLDVLRARAAERKIAVGGEDAAQVSGLPVGYVQKLLSAPPVKRIGHHSFGPLLAILGLRFIAVQDDDAIRRFGSRLSPRDERFVRSAKHNAVVHIRFTRRHMKKIGTAGGKNSRKNMDAERASAIGRKASTARWEKARRRKAVRSRKRHGEATP